MAFFFKNIYCRPFVSLGFTSVVFSVSGWFKPSAEGWLYASFYAILYEGFEHPGILVSARGGSGPGTNPPQILKDDWSLRGFSSYMQIFDCMGVIALNLCVVQGSTVFLIPRPYHQTLPPLHVKLRQWYQLHLCWLCAQVVIWLVGVIVGTGQGRCCLGSGFIAWLSHFVQAALLFWKFL